MSQDFDRNMTSSRKLTDDEAKQLRGIILKNLSYSDDEKEDVEDLLDYTFAMVSNGKPLSYIVHELVSMEVDVCNHDTANAIGRQIARFLSENVNRVQQPDPRFASTKSTGGESNALTMSGALKSSRERTKRDEGAPQDRRGGGGDRRDRNHRGGGGRGNTDRRGGGGRNSMQSRAFDRLSGGGRNDGGRRGRGDDRRGMSPGGRFDRGGGRGGRGFDPRGGRGGDRGGRGGGRGDGTWRGGREMGRGGRGERGSGRGPPFSGNRRTRDEMRGEEDFIPAGGRGGRGGRGDGRFGGRDGGRGQDRGWGRGGRGRDFQEGSKRQRIDESGWGQQGYSYEEWDGGYDEGYYDDSWRGGYRGGRGGRARSRGRGRGGRDGRGDGAAEDASGPATGGSGAQGEVGDEADAAHPSPIVAASLGGRGFRGRGRGRGRGRSSYRAHVASMIASKSWVRPKANGEGGDKGDDGAKQNGDSGETA